MGQTLALEGEVKYLKKEIERIHISNDERDQYSRKNNVIISGLVESKEEDLKATLPKLAAALDVPCSGVLAVHRLSETKFSAEKNIPRDIVVKFSMYEVKDSFISEFKKKFKEGMPANKVGGEAGDMIWLKDHLTPRRNFLLRQAKKRSTTHKFSYVWVKKCTVFVKAREGCRARMILTEKDIDLAVKDGINFDNALPGFPNPQAANEGNGARNSVKPKHTAESGDDEVTIVSETVPSEINIEVSEPKN